MRALLDVTPSAEQLSLFSRINGGVEVIRGAAGSGKTTTALLKLRSSIGSFLNRRRRQTNPEPLRILVLTYNRTLSGYVAELAHKQFAAQGDIELEISTFAKWSRRAQGNPIVLSVGEQAAILRSFQHSLNLDQSFIEEEIDYLVGRFLPKDLNDYLAMRREGRGGSPRMEKGTREEILKKIVYPYIEYKHQNGLVDWNDLAVGMCDEKYFQYDIVIVDETQDFSANQIRAVMNQLAPIHAVTFVLDTAQRIYARGFTWQEVGVNIRPENSFRLTMNYRNTQQIARLAASLVNGIGTDDDGTLPNFTGANRNGALPLMLVGEYKKQVAFVLKHIGEAVDLRSESVAFLHPKGGGWFDYLRGQLENADFPYVEITREAEWPQGDENIALSTLHSSKGLEFDHVFILGLNAQVLPHGDEDDDDKLITLRRLIAMGIGRAKKSVILGYKLEDKSEIIDIIDARSFQQVNV